MNITGVLLVVVGSVLVVCMNGWMGWIFKKNFTYAFSYPIGSVLIYAVCVCVGERKLKHFNFQYVCCINFCGKFAK